MQFMLSNSIII